VKEFGVETVSLRFPIGQGPQSELSQGLVGHEPSQDGMRPGAVDLLEREEGRDAPLMGLDTSATMFLNARLVSCDGLCRRISRWQAKLEAVLGRTGPRSIRPGRTSRDRVESSDSNPAG
jgi:hypothetical protein